MKHTRKVYRDPVSTSQSRKTHFHSAKTSSADKKTICIICQNPSVKGGIAAVVNGYRGSVLEEDYHMIYVESYRDGGKITKLWKALCSYLHFMKVLICEKPDLVHLHSSFGPSFYRKIPFIYLSRMAGKPVLNHIHGADFDTFYTNASPRKKKLISHVYHKCTAFIALSAQWEERLHKIVPDKPVYIVENYSVLHRDALMERMHRKSRAQVLFLGEIGKRKGCYDIPSIVSRVVAQVPDVRFVLAGTGEIDHIKALLLEKGISHKAAAQVIFPGWVRGDVKDKLLRESDLYFLPSYNEGMPMSVLDAMGYGLPIVSTRIGGIPEVVMDGRNGYTETPGDTERMASDIVSLLQDEGKLKSYSMESYRIVKERYSLERHLHLLEGVYEKLMS